MSPRSSSVPSEISPLCGPRLQRHEADDVDVVPAARGQRVRHVLDVLAGAHQHRAALVARRAQQEPRRALVGEAERRHVGDGEEERPVEDVVARELLAADDRVERDHDRHLEERGDDARQARAHRAVAVEPRLGEQQRRDEEREPHVVLGLVEHDRRVERVARGRLEPEGGGDGQEERDEVERQQRHGARDPAQRVHAQQERERRRALAAHVALGQRRRRRGRQRRRGPRPVLDRFARGHLPAPNGHQGEMSREWSRRRAFYLAAPTSMSTPAWSIVRRRPSCSGTLGSQPSSARARVMSGWRTFGSSTGSAS